MNLNSGQFAGNEGTPHVERTSISKLPYFAQRPQVHNDLIGQRVTTRQDVVVEDGCGVIARMPTDHGGHTCENPVERRLGQSDRVPAVHQPALVGRGVDIAVHGGLIVGDPRQRGRHVDHVSLMVVASDADLPVVVRTKRAKVPVGRCRVAEQRKVELAGRGADVVGVAGGLLTSARQ